MTRFAEWPLRLKLTVLVAVASSTGLIAALGAIFANEFRTVTPRARAALATQAANISFHATTAMLFGDEEDADHTLLALQLNRDIVAAALYTREGTVFAHYLPPGASLGSLPPRPGEDGFRFAGGDLELVYPVTHENERIGSLFLRSDLGGFYAGLAGYLQLASLLALAGILVAVLASTVLSRIIAAPIYTLARVAKNVTERKDYTLRAQKRAADEIGQLVDAFNEMLARIQARDRELLAAQGDLELRVRQRTAELEAINRSLSQEVAARKAAEAELIVARDRAEAANRAKSTFLANMSHDLRTPLTAVLGYAELLEEEALGRGHREYVEDIGRIRTAAHHLLSMLSDLLDLSRIEVGRLELQPELIDVPAFLAEFEATSRPLCDANRNRLTVSSAADVPNLFADRTRLRQVLYNLVSNAAKFTKQGEVGLALERYAAGGERSVRIQVRDTGIGIPPAQLSRIFEPFVQGSAEIGYAYGGAGLGLAICKRCCELMGGNIAAVSTPGQGSTFTAILPIAAPNGVPRKAAPVPANAHAA